MTGLVIATLVLAAFFYLLLRRTPPPIAPRLPSWIVGVDIITSDLLPQNTIYVSAHHDFRWLRPTDGPIGWHEPTPWERERMAYWDGVLGQPSETAHFTITNVDL